MENSATPTHSLRHFFKTQDPATLCDCDQEQVHLIGRIMAGCGMLVLHRGTGEITAASEGVEHILGCDREHLLGRPFAEVWPEVSAPLREAGEDQALHTILEETIDAGGVTFDVVTHAQGSQQFIEFIPNSEASNARFRGNMRECSRACARIMNADSFEAGLLIGTAALRKITGYARVMIYEFQPDWTGKVIAESRNGDLQSYDGLCFPAADIPKQARELMKMVPYRVIGNTGDESPAIETLSNQPDEIDLTWSIARAASVMHTQYLRNMGVEASFSCSLMQKDALWGMIALHDTGPGYLPFDSWSMVQEIGAALMMRFDQEQRVETNKMITKLREIENKFASTLRKSGDVEDVLVTLIPVLQKFMNADGFAMQYGSNLYIEGRAPPKDFITKLLKWSCSTVSGMDLLQSSELHRLWPPAKAHIDTACGVLIQPVAVHRVCQLVWFRGPVTNTVHWAGKQTAKPAKDGRLSPRDSFEKWTTQNAELSLAWRPSELKSAREIFTEFLDIIATQLLLKEENANLRQFAYAAAHDIKAPLRGIEMALDWMIEEEFDPSVVRETHSIAHSTSRQLLDLTDGLLEMAVIQEQSIERTNVPVASVFETVISLLSGVIAQSGAVVRIGDMPTVYANERLLVRLFLNLISNAVKYRHTDRKPQISVAAGPVINNLASITITDNGIGVPPEFAERIFRPMERLHLQDETEGAGLGLAICKSIVTAHNGHLSLDTEYQDGAQFQLYLPIQDKG